MFFKNLYTLLFDPEKVFVFGDHEQPLLAEKEFSTCSPTQRESVGWVPPIMGNKGVFTHSVAGFVAMTMVVQTRLLPSSVVKEALVEKVAEILESESRVVGNQEKKVIREEIEMELLPQAFLRTVRVNGYIDLHHGRLHIDTSSQQVAETFCTLLRKTLGSLPVTLPDDGVVAVKLTRWVTDQVAPDKFTLGYSCEMQSQGDDKANVLFKHHELGTGEVLENVNAGKYVKRLALTWDDKITFVVNEGLQITTLKMLNVITDEQPDPQSEAESFGIDFALMSGEVALLLNDLYAVLIDE